MVERFAKMMGDYTLYLSLPIWADDQEDEKKIQRCLDSLECCDNIHLIVYHQYGDRVLIEASLGKRKFQYDLIGEGENEGEIVARKRTLEYIISNYPDSKYCADIEQNMVFSVNWHKSLIQFLEESNEPLVMPYVIKNEELSQPFPMERKEQEMVFSQYTKEIILQDEVSYPVIHQVDELLKIEPYDLRFFTGKEGYALESIVLGHSYSKGLRRMWKPKTTMVACVYQEREINYRCEQEEREKNRWGLIVQYGGYGMKELARLTGKEEFQRLYRERKLDEQGKEKWKI